MSDFNIKLIDEDKLWKWLGIFFVLGIKRILCINVVVINLAVDDAWKSKKSKKKKKWEERVKYGMLTVDMSVCEWVKEFKGVSVSVNVDIE